MSICTHRRIQLNTINEIVVLFLFIFFLCVKLSLVEICIGQQCIHEHGEEKNKQNLLKYVYNKFICKIQAKKLFNDEQQIKSGQCESRRMKNYFLNVHQYTHPLHKKC